MNSARNQDIELNQYYKIPMPYQQQDDEISLIDIFRILAKHKYLILIITLLVSLAGSAYAFLKQDVFSYATAIQLGSIAVGGETKPIADIIAVEAKMKSLYIPRTIDDYYRANPGQKRNINISVSVPKGGDALQIESKCSDKIAPVCINLIDKISGLIVSDLIQKTDNYKTSLNVQIVNASKRLTELDNDFLQINRKIETFENTLKASNANNIAINALINTELFAQAQAITREKYALESLITNKQSDLNLIQATKALYPTTKSLDTVDIGKQLIIFASLFMGVFLGIFAALIFNFIEKMKSQLNPKPN
jgi:Chain length determinant protein